MCLVWWTWKTKMLSTVWWTWKTQMLSTVWWTWKTQMLSTVWWTWKTSELGIVDLENSHAYNYHYSHKMSSYFLQYNITMHR